MENIEMEHQEHRNRFNRKKVDDQKKVIEDQIERIMELLYKKDE